MENENSQTNTTEFSDNIQTTGQTQPSSITESGDRGNKGNTPDELNGAGSNGSETSTESQVDAKMLAQIEQEQKEIALEDYVKQCREADVLVINAFELRKSHPKGYQDTVAYMKSKSQTVLEEDTIIGVFLYSPRQILLDYFDNKSYHLNCTIDLSGQNKPVWGYTINDEISTTKFDSRSQAEYSGYMAVYDLIEKQLK